MSKQSAGILLFRRTTGAVEFLLVHPGGPFFRNKDLGVWSIPKGEFSETEDPKTAAVRELEEETGYRLEAPLLPLNAIKQKGGKTVLAWAAEGDLDAELITSNTFTLEWPPRSGQMQEFPEVDRAAWFKADEARARINPAQFALIEELIGILDSGGAATT
jgi:predicted NUDIX family NTP pyrophosphohydrolase